MKMSKPRNEDEHSKIKAMAICTSFEIDGLEISRGLIRFLNVAGVFCGGSGVRGSQLQRSNCMLSSNFFTRRAP
jgi:hypothetical protein